MAQFHWLRISRDSSPTSSATGVITKVLLKRKVRKSKFDPLIDEVELIEANPKYAHVRFPDGGEDTVSTKFLAPQVKRNVLHEPFPKQPHTTADLSNDVQIPTTTTVDQKSEQTSGILCKVDNSNVVKPISDPQAIQHIQSSKSQPLRRLERVRKSPDRLIYV